MAEHSYSELNTLQGKDGGNLPVPNISNMNEPPPCPPVAAKDNTCRGAKMTRSTLHMAILCPAAFKGCCWRLDASTVKRHEVAIRLAKDITVDVDMVVMHFPLRDENVNCESEKLCANKGSSHCLSHKQSRASLVEARKWDF